MRFTAKHVITLLLGFFLFRPSSFSQCSVQTGPPPPLQAFVSGIGNPGNPDKNWQVSVDSVNYVPATIMSGLPDLYFKNYAWISFSTSGEHTGDKFFFYKKQFDLPCFNLCGKSYNLDNSFCLTLGLYADNSIYEIYVNGVPQSANLGNIHLPDPFNPPSLNQSSGTLVQLCKNWKAGANELVIQLASSATVAGIMVSSVESPPPPPDAYTYADTICEGDSYIFGVQTVTQSGTYYRVAHGAGGCDSNIVLNLQVNAKARLTVNQTICEGQSFLGYVKTGTYVDSFPSSNGCDSVRTLHLMVQGKPIPDLGNQDALCVGDSMVLYPGPFMSYLWQDGSTLDHYNVTSPGLYGVTVMNSCGTGSSQILIREGICDDYFPTAFTANHDGLNDNFKILTHAQLEEYHLVVYNRYGQKIFETHNPNQGWDGSFKGKLQSSGVYVWKCSFRRQSNLNTRKGTVLLIQ